MGYEGGGGVAQAQNSLNSFAYKKDIVLGVYIGACPAELPSVAAPAGPGGVAAGSQHRAQVFSPPEITVTYYFYFYLFYNINQTHPNP